MGLHLPLLLDVGYDFPIPALPLSEIHLSFGSSLELEDRWTTCYRKETADKMSLSIKPVI